MDLLSQLHTSITDLAKQFDNSIGYIFTNSPSIYSLDLLEKNPSLSDPDFIKTVKIIF